MLTSLVAVLVLTVGAQSPAVDRTQAEQLARAGRTVEAMEMFVRIVEQDPGDTEARLWVARLALRLGRTADAEAGFRSVLREHPADVDARIGLGATLTRRGAWRQALDVLQEAERDAGENADLFSALARAYRRAGNDRRALDYFRRARALAPDDPDVVLGFEATARVYGHSIAFESFGEQPTAGSSAASGALAVNFRVVPRLHVLASARAQRREADPADATVGGGLTWRLARSTTVGVNAIGGSGNVALPRRDVSGDLMHYAGTLEIGGGIRQLSFAGVDVLAASPVWSWDGGGRWRLDTRYTYSRSWFDDAVESTGDHSVLLRGTWRGWRRAAVNAAYAYGIESFEDLTADRVGSLGTTTVATGLRVDVPSLTTVTTTWEHQWRSNSTTVNRLTVSVVQSIP